MTGSAWYAACCYTQVVGWCGAHIWVVALALLPGALVLAIYCYGRRLAHPRRQVKPHNDLKKYRNEQ